MPTPQHLARNDEEWKALLESDEPNVVRTMRDWHRLIASDENPLRGLDTNIIAEFTKTLQFNNGGLAGADYSMLADVVPYSNFMLIWEHFGMAGVLLAEHTNYRCAGQGTCSPSDNNICTSNC